MFEHLDQVFFRSVIGFGLLLLLARWMGKKQMGQLTYFDYVTSITIGSIAAVTAVEHNVHLMDSLAALLLWAIFTIVLNIITIKNRNWRKILDGEACLVISNGQILEQNMRKMHYSLDDLLEHLRQKDMFSIADVQFAVLETSGELSVQLKPEKQPVTKQDMLITVPFQTLPVELIMDGEVVQQNLEQKHLTKDWLINELAKRGISNISEVIYACLGSDQKLYIDIMKDTNTETFNITD